MTIKYADWLGENTRTVGQGTLTLAGAILGYASFANLGDCEVYYTIVDGQNKECGIGTILGRELSRQPKSVMIGDQYLANSAPINLSGNAQVYGTIIADFFSHMVLNTEPWVVSLPNDLASKYSPTNKPTPAAIGAEATGVAEQLVAGHSNGTNVHNIQGVNGLQPALDSKQSKIQGAFGFRNILINGAMIINQRGFSGSWSLLPVGAYGYDRWKKNDTTSIVQVIEAGNFIPNSTYTLSGTNIVTQQIGSPASGNWIVVVPSNARNVQLEFGNVATPFENRHVSIELAMCQRYYQELELSFGSYSPVAGAVIGERVGFIAQMYAIPNIILKTAPSSINISGFTWNNTTAKSTWLVFTATVQGQWNWLGTAIFTAEL